MIPHEAHLVGQTEEIKTMSKPMTKTELVAALAEELGSDKKAAAAALDAVCAIITKEVAAGGAVTLPGVGKVFCKDQPARMVRNPSTGEQFMKDASKAVKMTFAKAIKDSVNA
jgi:DNA-binding protein HU-beta